MLKSRLRTDRQTDGNVKVEQYSAEAESAITLLGSILIYQEEFLLPFLSKVFWLELFRFKYV